MQQLIRTAAQRSRNYFPFAIVIAFLPATPCTAAQFDLHGPAGSVAFGTAVAVLPNGNVVVTDPQAASSAGVVYLYSPRGVLINSFTGSAANDLVGSGGITVLKNGNFVISSPAWGGGVGAATWVNGNAGFSGVVSAANSLVGTHAGDRVGSTVYALTNGNYVVASTDWANGDAAQSGAVTWADGNKSTSGFVSAANSMVGAQSGDQVGGGSRIISTIGSHVIYVGGVTVLRNGDYVIASPNWANGGATLAGAVTWGSGGEPATGVVSATNSLIGVAFDDSAGIGGITELANGNYVVASPYWSNNGASKVGAATWSQSGSGVTGKISAGNSLVGTRASDGVGTFVTALTNGNYVVVSPSWSSGTAILVGAATWVNGDTGMTGWITAENSLIGTSNYDEVGSSGVTALTNGNYVVSSGGWTNGVPYSEFGAVTWANGSTGLHGTVSTTNSLVGTTSRDGVGGGGVTALSNGNYVVVSNDWNTATAKNVGAVTWANGATGLIGVVSVDNSLVGTNADDAVGNPGVTALANGNYVVASALWNNGASAQIGAATWANGNTGLAGPVSVENSLVGTIPFDDVASDGATALSNGNYVVGSYSWQGGFGEFAGAHTWADGSTGIRGAVSSANSLIGTRPHDGLGGARVITFSNGNYAVFLPDWANGPIAQAGAVSFGLGTGGLVDVVTTTNSVLGSAPGGGPTMVLAYDTARSQLVVGKPAESVVTFFRYDPIFSNGFNAP